MDIEKRVYVVGELGNTHDGNIKVAKKLISECRQARVDAVSFNKRDPNSYPNSPMISPNLVKTTVRDYIKSNEFWKDDYDEINSFCNELKVSWFPVVYDTNSLEFMEKNYNSSIYKIPEVKINDIDFIDTVASLGRYTLLATGMCHEYELDRAVNTFLRKNSNLILLHSITVFPTAFGDVNLRVMRTIHKRYELHTGYSSNEIDNSVCLAAVGMGAKIIEKKVTLDRASMFGLNHVLAIDPVDLSKLVKDIRNIEKSFGSASKKLLDREIPYREAETVWQG